MNVPTLPLPQTRNAHSSPWLEGQGTPGRFVDSAYFAIIDTPNKAYWLGVLAADGCVYYTHNKWGFQFIVAEKDQSWLFLFRNEVRSNHPVRILPGGFGTPCCRFVVTDQNLCSTLLTLNFKSADILQRVAKALHPHFIRGLFDGDDDGRGAEGGLPCDPLNRETPVVEAAILMHGELLLLAEQGGAQQHDGIQPQETSQHQSDALRPPPLTAKKEVEESKEGEDAPPKQQ